jgi:hypothetical protein
MYKVILGDTSRDKYVSYAPQNMLHKSQLAPDQGYSYFNRTKKLYSLNILNMFTVINQIFKGS